MVLQVAGFFVQDIPDWIGWLKYVSFIYYGYNTLLKVNCVSLCTVAVMAQSFKLPTVLLCYPSLTWHRVLSIQVLVCYPYFVLPYNQVLVSTLPDSAQTSST